MCLEGDIHPPHPRSSPGTASTVAAVPAVLSAVGFTSAGITASSLAAKMMSISAIANGGGVAAGSLVATLQSVGKCPGRGLLLGLRGKDRSLSASGPDLSPSEPQSACPLVLPPWSPPPPPSGFL